MSTDWSACYICQKDRSEKLRSTVKDHETLTKFLPKLAEVKCISISFYKTRNPRSNAARKLQTTKCRLPSFSLQQI